MKRISALILCVCIMLCFAACGDNSAVQKNNSDENNTAQTVPSASGNDNKVLIAYFTWAENTVVENPNSVPVDASTSASVLLPGNASKLAGWINERVGGDLFSIQVENLYSSDYDECLDRAAGEKADNARPTLKTHIENIDDYDTVFIGYPNWWYSCPMAILSFIDEYNFSGKTVVLFCTHGTGGLANSVETITSELPSDCTVIDNVIGVYRDNIASAQPKINEWLDEIGFSENSSAESSQADNENRITMTVNNRKISILLYDTPAAQSLYNMLPLTLSFEDFNSTEKIAYLQNQLQTDGEPDSFDPDTGDLCLYEPWGNLSIFYKDYRNSNGLISLGKVESGMDIISAMDGDFQVTLEKS